MFIQSTTKDQLDRKAVYNALTDNGTFATVLHVICLISYGEDIYSVDPLELHLRLEEDYGAKLTDENENKLNAILLATSTDAFYEDEEAFRSITNTLLEGDPGFETLDDLTLAEIFWAVYEVELNHGEEELSPAIQQLIAREIDEEADDSVVIEELKPNYVLRAMADYRRQLYKQLKSIGIKDVDLPPIS